MSFVLLMCSHQDAAYLSEIKQHREELNNEYLDEVRSPLSKEERENFRGHDFFSIDQAYRVQAQLERTPNSRPFQMVMSTGRTQLYKKFGVLKFELKGQELELEAYTRFQSFGLSMKTTPVLIPIIDHTTGQTTYDGGRYLTFNSVPEGDEWTIDFNKLYNPYCAYNDQIACPRVPEANHLKISIEAGVRGPKN